jgi:hypothetical protein
MRSVALTSVAAACLLAACGPGALLPGNPPGPRVGSLDQEAG